MPSTPQTTNGQIIRYSSGNPVYSGGNNSSKPGGMPNIPFSPTYAPDIREFLRRIDEGYANIATMRDRLAQDYGIARSDAQTSYQRAARNLQAGLASGNNLLGGGARRVIGEQSDDYNRQLRDLGIGQSRAVGDLETDFVSQLGQNIRGLQQAQLGAGREGAQSALDRAFNEARTFANREAQTKLQQLIGALRG